MIFLFYLWSYFSVVIMRRIDTVFDEVAEEGKGEGFEDFEDQANPGKQPFDHDTLVLRNSFVSDA